MGPYNVNESTGDKPVLTNPSAHHTHEYTQLRSLKLKSDCKQCPIINRFVEKNKIIVLKLNH